MQPIQPMRLTPLTTGKPVVWTIGKPAIQNPFSCHQTLKIDGVTPSAVGRGLKQLLSGVQVKFPHVILCDSNQEINQSTNWGPLMPQIVSRLEDVDFINRRFYDLDLSLKSFFSKENTDSQIANQTFISGVFFGLLESQLNISSLLTPNGYGHIVRQYPNLLTWSHEIISSKQIISNRLIQEIIPILRERGYIELEARAQAKTWTKDLLKDWKFILESGATKPKPYTRSLPVINATALDRLLKEIYPQDVSAVTVNMNFSPNPLSANGDVFTSSENPLSPPQERIVGGIN